MENLSGYKLSKTLLHKMVQNSKKGGASGYEIDALLYMSMICDSKGYIPQLKITSLKEQLGCSERECYHIFSSLVQKNMIEVSCKKKNGYRDVTLLHNNFMNKNLKKSPYLNVNNSYFIPKAYENTQNWKHFSCGAKKLFLCLADSYNTKYGAKIGIRKICKKMGIQNENTIKEYFKELNFLDIKVQSSHKNGVFYRIKDNLNFEKRSGISTSQPSYLKYRLEKMLEDAMKDGIKILHYERAACKKIDKGSEHFKKLLQGTSNIIIHALNEKIVGLEAILGILREKIYLDQAFSIATLTHIHNAVQIITSENFIGPADSFSHLVLSEHYFA